MRKRYWPGAFDRVSIAGIIRLPDRRSRSISETNLLNFVKSLLIMVLHVSTTGIFRQGRRKSRLGALPLELDFAQRLPGVSRAEDRTDRTRALKLMPMHCVENGNYDEIGDSDPASNTRSLKPALESGT